MRKTARGLITYLALPSHISLIQYHWVPRRRMRLQRLAFHVT